MGEHSYQGSGYVTYAGFEEEGVLYSGGSGIASFGLYDITVTVGSYTYLVNVGITEEGEKYHLKLKAKSNTVAYDHLEMEADKESLIPTEIRCYATSGILIKTLHYSKIKDFGNGLVRPSMLETDSPLQKGYRSVMLFDGITAREFSDETFTLNFLPKVEELR